MSPETKQVFTVRVDPKVLEEFKKWCQKMRKHPSSFVRELIESAANGQLTISLTKNPNQTVKELYK